MMVMMIMICVQVTLNSEQGELIEFKFFLGLSSDRSLSNMTWKQKLFDSFFCGDTVWSIDQISAH